MYKKHDSFFALKHKKDQKINSILKRIDKVSKNSLIIEKLSTEGKVILKKVIGDLFGNTNKSSNIKFYLKSNVVSEIDTISDAREHFGFDSSITITFPVFLTDDKIISSSNGEYERGSIISQFIFLSRTSKAACSANIIIL